MAPVKQLGEVSWSVVCAACCHMAFVIFANLLLSTPFHTFFQSGIDKSTEWSTISACPSLMCFFFYFYFLAGMIPKGLILPKMLCSMFVYVLLYVNLCQD